MVTLQAPGNSTVENQAATFMHELGHTLGLGHGGELAPMVGSVSKGSTTVDFNGLPGASQFFNDMVGMSVSANDIGFNTTIASVDIINHQITLNNPATGTGETTLYISDSTNYKPNYESIMNYEWQFPSPLNAQFNASWKLDYSRTALPSLNENSLNEPAGVSGTNGLTEGVLPVFNTPGNQNSGLRNYRQFVSDSLPIDWNFNDGNTTDTGIAVDVNGDGKNSDLVGSEDWSKLVYNFRGDYAFSNDGAHPTDTDFPSNNPSFSGVLSYQAASSLGPNDLTLRLNGANLEIYDSDSQAVVASLPYAEAKLVQIFGADGAANNLTIDFSGGYFTVTGGITFIGGAGGNNQLRIIGNGKTTGAYMPDGTAGITPGSGTMQVASGGQSVSIAFVGLQPIEVSGMASYQLVTPNSNNNVTLAAGSGSSGQSAEVVSGSSGGVPFENLTFFGIPLFTLDVGTNDGASSNDTINVQATLNGTTTTIQTGAGVDTINVSSDAGRNVPVQGRHIDTIQGPLVITGGGKDTLNVDDSDTASDKSATLTSNSLIGLGMSPSGISYSGLENLNVNLGSGNNVFTIQNTAAATTTSINGGPSEDTFNVQEIARASTLTLDGKDGSDTYNYAVGSGGIIRIVDTGNTGTDSAVITGTNSGDTFNINVDPNKLIYGLDTVIYDKNLEKLTVNGGIGSDVFNVTPSTATSFILDGGVPAPPTSPGDTLNLDLKGSTGAFRTATSTPSGYEGSWTFANRQPVNFTHMERLTPALHLSGAGTPINGFEYSALNGTLAAKFINADFLVPASDFVASIDWGDGKVTPGTITLSGNTYLIRGSHTYTDESIYTVKVTVSGDLTSAHFTTSATMLEQLLPDGTRGTPNQRFISELFRDLLQRPVDQGSLNFWNNLLNLGLPQTFVVLGIESTPEYRQLQVQSLYQRYLHRQPNSFELTMGTDFLLAGATPEQLAMYLVSTPEFFFQQGGGSLTGYLSAFYKDALQSPVLADVEMADMMQMAQGASLTDIVQEVLHQPDYQQGVVNDGILSLLDRNPTGTEASNLTLALEMGLTDDDVLALLATTTPYQEYFDKTAN